jgi:PAS domain S-box-containing protein
MDKSNNKHIKKMSFKLYIRQILLACILLPLSTYSAPADDLINDRLILSTEEIKWLKANPEVIFTGDPNWLPYEAFTKKGEYIGIVASHLEIISKITGLTFKLSPSKTWTESTQKAKNGLVDILSETDDSDLKSHLNFTQPYLSNPIVIAMGINENYVESISNIANKRIALIKDYGYASKIRRKYSEIEFITVDNIQDGLISVSTGKVDALFCTLALCSYTIHELGLSDVKITGKTEFDTKLALGIQKDKPELLSILNKAISNITQGQQQLILDQWVKHEYIEKIDYTLTYAVTFIAFTLLSLFFYWNRRLSHEVKLRLETETKLQETVNRNTIYRTLFSDSPIGNAVNTLSTGDFISVNQAFAKITGYTLNELNQLSYWDLTPKSYAEDEETQIRSLKETGVYGPYKKHYIHKDGSLIAVRLNGSIITTPDNEKLILSVVEDITDRETLQKKLILSEKRFRSLFDLSPDPVWLIEDNRFIDCNQAAVNILGYNNKEAILNTHPAELSPTFQPDGVESFAKAERMLKLAKTKDVHRFEWVHTDINGTNLFVEVTLSQIEVENKPLIFCAWRDISALKESEKIKGHQNNQQP